VTRSSLAPGLQVSVRAGFAAGLSVAVAQLLRLEFPIYAMIAAVIVTHLSPERTRQLALPRLVGTVVGSTLGAALSPVVVPRPAAIVLTVVAAMFACHLLRLPDAAKVAGYVCGIVLLDYPWGAVGVWRGAVGVWRVSPCRNSVGYWHCRTRESRAQGDTHRRPRPLVTT
jgi:hypothetical protein